MSELVRKTEDQLDAFIIDSDQKAEWAIQKIIEARKDQTTWKEFYKNRMQQIDEETDANVNNLEAMLRDYFESVPHKKTATQENYSLPSGKLVLKKQEPEYKRDNETLIEWMRKACPELIKVEESPDWSALKKRVNVFDGNVITEDAEIVPGVEVINRPEKFTVEVK